MSIKKFVRLGTSVVAANATLANTALTIPIAANQRLTGRVIAFVTVGATGGVRASLTVPAGGSSYSNMAVLTNSVTDAIVAEFQAAAAAFANALANAGTHLLVFDFDVVNGSTAGAVTFQFAQNTTDALTATLLAGSSISADQT